MSRKVFLALAVVACLAGGGCGSRVAYKYRIAVIPKGLTHEFWQSIHRGAERAAADLKGEGILVEVLWDGPRKESDASEQIALVDQKAGMGIQGLVLAPQDSKGMVPVVERTVDKGIPTVIIDSGLDPEALKRRPDLIVKYVATDNYHGGELAAQRLVEVLTKAGKEAPKVVLFRYQVGSESTEQREQGFLDQIDKENSARKKAGKAPVEVISKDKYAGATVDTAYSEANPLLLQVKNRADGIFAVNESAATGMLNAMRSQGLNKKIRLVAFDSSEPLLQAVKEDDVDGLIVQDPYRMGYLGVWTLVRFLEGDDVRAGAQHISTGEYLLTKENLKSETSRGLFDRQTQAKRTIDRPVFKKK
jgi:ribose transport system substrate-binding protein